MEALWLMLQDSITEHDLLQSERLLTYFCQMFGTIYGERYMTLNIHYHLHLPMCVRNLGPLWCQSCFHFENMNWKLLKLFHGTQQVELQIACNIGLFRKLPCMIEAVLDETLEGKFL